MYRRSTIVFLFVIFVFVGFCLIILQDSNLFVPGENVTLQSKTQLKDQLAHHTKSPTKTLTIAEQKSPYVANSTVNSGYPTHSPAPSTPAPSIVKIVVPSAVADYSTTLQALHYPLARNADVTSQPELNTISTLALPEEVVATTERTMSEDQLTRHREQTLTAGWQKYASRILSRERDPRTYPTFSQMVEVPHQDARLLVKLNKGHNPVTALESIGVVHDRSIERGSLTKDLHRYIVPVDLSMIQALEVVNGHNAVAFAEPAYLMTQDMLPEIPNDELAQPDTAWWWTRVNAYEAWDYATDASAIGPIAIIDTGISVTHPDLRDNLWVNTDEIAGNGIDDDGNGYVDDIHGANSTEFNGNLEEIRAHGTQASGLVCAQGNNNIGVTGAAWDCQLMMLPFGDGSVSVEEVVVAGMQYAIDNGARIMLHEYGRSVNSIVLQEAFDASESADILHIIPAANNGINFDTDDSSAQRYPQTYTNPNTIVVGASFVDETIASYSNRGAISVDLAAPTTMVTTAGIDEYKTFGGTSAATPVVAGAAALIWSRTPAWTAASVKSHLLANVRPDAAWQGLSVTGGLLDMGAALRNQVVDSSVVLSVSDARVNESDDTATITIGLSSAASSPVTARVFTQAGTATEGVDYTGYASDITIAAGSTTFPITVQLINDNDVEGDETFNIRIDNVTGAQVIDNTATVVIRDNPVRPLISTFDALVQEDTGTVAIQVSLSESTSVDVTVTVFTPRKGTATAGEDYYGFSKRITIPAGSTSMTTELEIINDTLAETDETLQIQMVRSVGADINADKAIGTITIVDNDVTDVAPEISIADLAVVEGSGAGRMVVSLSTLHNRDVSVRVFANPVGTAIQGVDFYGFAKDLTIRTGSRSAGVFVIIRDDYIKEPDETLFVRLARAQGAIIADNKATLTILDDDDNTPPLLSIDSVTVNEGAGQAILTVTLSEAVDASVRMATSNGTAVQGSDFYGFSNTVNFAGGSTSQTITVDVLDDETSESTETMSVRLYRATGAEIDTNCCATVTIIDND